MVALKALSGSDALITTMLFTLVSYTNRLLVYCAPYMERNELSRFQISIFGAKILQFLVTVPFIENVEFIIMYTTCPNKAM